MRQPLSSLMRCMASLAGSGAAGGDRGALIAAEVEKAVPRDYSLVRAAAAPRTQEWAAADAKSAGLLSAIRQAMPVRCTPPRLSCSAVPTAMAAILQSCIGCVGPTKRHDYVAARDRAHGLSQYPKSWQLAFQRQPQRSYTLLNREAPNSSASSSHRIIGLKGELQRLPHRGDRGGRAVADGHGRNVFGGAAYIMASCRSKTTFGEAYTRRGEQAKIVSPSLSADAPCPRRPRRRGALAELIPAADWQVTPPGDVFACSSAAGARWHASSRDRACPRFGIDPAAGGTRPPRHTSVYRGPDTGLRVASQFSTSTRRG